MEETSSVKGPAAAAATADAVAELATSAIKEAIKAMSGSYKIGAAIINNTEYKLEKVDGTGKALHGKVYDPPAGVIGPLSANEDPTKATNYSDWLMKQGGARCSEAVMLYKLTGKGKHKYICFYLKHGHNFEAGAFIMQKDTFEDGDHNGYWKYPDGQATGERMIHYIQKYAPKGGKDSKYCKYSTKGQSATVRHGDLVMRFQSAENVEFDLRQEGFSED